MVIARTPTEDKVAYARKLCGAAGMEFVAVLFLAVDKPDFELRIKQRFRRQILVCKAEVKFLLTVG